MVFIGGPRQVGKTTLALEFLKPASVKNPSYLNWDNIQARSSFLKGEIPLSSGTIVLDEIHKYSKWRNTLKGLFDVHKDDVKFLVTGSARLDHFKKGGDSLLGRYFYYRLHPLSLMELSNKPNKEQAQALLQLSGFPEPFFSGREKDYKRWHLSRVDRVIYSDINDLENVRDVALLQILLESLDSRVGSPLSIENLRQGLQVGHGSVTRWLDIFDAVYLSFRIAPFGAPKIRAVKKEQKLYLWDWAQIADEGARFENFVASHLLKYCHFIEDTEGDKMELRYLRDRDGREVDFVVIKNKKPLFAVEAKKSETSLSPHISYFKERTGIPEFYQVHMGDKDFGHPAKAGRSLPFWTFCREKQLI